MTDKELIQALRHCGKFEDMEDHSCIGCPAEGKGCAGAFLLAADRLETLLAENEHFRDLTKMMPQWVSVEEQLPGSNDKQILVVVNGIYDGIHFYDAVEIAEFVMDEGWILESWPDWENPCVTFWQPLPKPPSTEGVE